MMDITKAQQLILQATPLLGHESVSLLDSLQRVLAADIVAADDFPSSHISAKDGYALRHSSLRNTSHNNTIRLKIIGESAAGRPCAATVEAGEAVRIMTGGMIPDGADTVIALEAAFEAQGVVTCSGNWRRGSNVRLRGESLQSGDIVFRAGDVIGPLHIGALASLRRAFVDVYCKPVVAIMATGDELTDFHEPPAPGKAMSSNLYGLAAQVLECGAIPLCLGITRDDLDSLRLKMSTALRADVVITSGGMSKGKYDLTRTTFASLGMDMDAAILLGKTSKPSIFGKIGEKLVFGLPGNPSAAMISFEQFVKPALLKMMGHTKVFQYQMDSDSKEASNITCWGKVKGSSCGAAHEPEEERAPLIPLTMLGANSGDKRAESVATCIEESPGGRLIRASFLR